MGWYRASHFSCERISTRVAPGRRPLWKMRSSNGGWHGLAGWGFRGFPETGAGLWADDGADSVSDAGSSLALTNLCLAELRSVSELPGAQGFSLVLAAEARRAAVLRHRCALQADQACRTARRRRRVQVALIEHRCTSVGSLSLSPPCEARSVLAFSHNIERENVDGQAEADIAGRGPHRRPEKIAGAQDRCQQDSRQIHRAKNHQGQGSQDQGARAADAQGRSSETAHRH